jgi:hypothetical protein
VSAAAGVLPPSVTKEIRALFPTYAAALASIAIGCVSSSYLMIAVGLLGFGFGSIALGAQSFGLEYSQRTLGLLLSQPVDRRRVYFYKLAVLSVMLVTLTVAILVLYEDLLRRASSPHAEPSMLILAAACGLFVAPTLTMICRSTLAGIVFTVGIPGLLSVGADVVGALRYGIENTAAIDRFKMLVFWQGMLVICALGAVAGWRMFMRLEVIEGHSHIQFPESLIGDVATPAASAVRQHWTWALVKKELRIQQMAFVVAALFALVMGGLMWLDASRAEGTKLHLALIAMLYTGVLAILIGSSASANERQFGTLEWQILLPVPAWQQWAVKIAVVGVLGLLLGIGLPALMGAFESSQEIFERRAAVQVALMMLLLTSGSVYLSTLCTSGVEALVLSFPTIVATSFLPMTIGNIVGPVVMQYRRAHPLSRSYLELDAVSLPLYAIGGGLVALLLWLAFLNHRSADRSLAGTSKQVLAIGGYIVVGLTVVIVLGAG